MLFNSYIFVLLFLPLCVAGYFVLNRLGWTTLALTYLLGMSLWFYGANKPIYLVLLCSSVLVNYGFYRLSLVLTGERRRRAAKYIAVAVNLGVLFYFKYYDFFAETVNSLLRADWTLRHVLLPLGISFFTFQQISFVIDAFNREVKPCSLLEYACFITFFPQLVAGPIVTHDELLPQLQDASRKRFDFESFSRGIYIFTIGLAKKVLIADTLSKCVTVFYGSVAAGNWSSVNSSNALVVMLAYTLEMYFDFSGYSDMAIGIGRMFNIDLPQNFNSPYKAVTILDHWKRWHITLTRFLTKYVYIPLGGSRRGAARTYINVMIVYLLSGFWHGAGWTFVCWGALHGLFCVLTRAGKRFFDKIPKPVNWLITFTFINLGFIIFRADSLSDAFAIIGRIFAFDFGPVAYNIYNGFCLTELMLPLSLIPVVGKYVYWPPMMMILFLVGCMLLVLVPKNAYERMTALKPRPLTMLFVSVLFVWCVFCFGTVSAFLYFNF